MYIYKPDYLVMTAGPTMVSGNVLQARAKAFGNPDLDPDFFTFYQSVCDKLKIFFGTEKAQMIIMNGEGMLALDAACASLTEKGDEVLVISNGVFGEGFKDLILQYGGNVTIYESDWKSGLSASKLEEFLKSKSNFKFATIVHCDTPSGVLNDIGPICNLLKSKGILTVVDTVAAVGGTELKVDEWNIDIALGGSQKVFSAPSGLSLLSISDDAWDAIENRTTPIPSFYCNLSYWKNCVEEMLFPYTMPASDIMGLNAALGNLLSERPNRVIERHEEMRDYTIERLKDMGIELYLNDSFSPTVTAFLVPEGYDAQEIINHMKNKYKILIANSYGPLKNKVLRIGHMGENARFDRVMFTLDNLEKTLCDLKRG
ncbi:alanine--glyoxylate aminotransferase family protein [Cetobacterium sp. 2A]|uniref:pyridoxal-phosphate-dependent aminotransferase family protein n=1 Tax=Cetobacterium sp. 2A TaxID=2754723 RepID=UPI00163BCAE6|nr:alanine--glyoxylate aminotransferase family protein [Cetobacterium sp. 2A]MBC2855869.1 alanine--glyoxylate aminotransferase family protein [Cetobacterium sp. 2A]